MMVERGIKVSHTTIMRWVHQYAPELDKKIRRKLKHTRDSWKLDETYIKIKDKWKYLYRAVDKEALVQKLRHYVILNPLFSYDGV